MDAPCPRATVIGLCGRKGSGKDTAAQQLIREHGFLQYTFAGLLKQICQLVFGFDNRQTDGDLKELVDPYWNITPRQAFQQIGTDLFRTHLYERLPTLRRQPSVWVSHFQRWYANLPTHTRVIVTDVRFADEADAIRQLGGILIRIQRPTSTVPDGEVRVHDSHVSEEWCEHPSKQVDYTIQNNSTPETLWAQVGQIANCRI